MDNHVIISANNMLTFWPGFLLQEFNKECTSKDNFQTLLLDKFKSKAHCSSNQIWDCTNEQFQNHKEAYSSSRTCYHRDPSILALTSNISLLAHFSQLVTSLMNCILLLLVLNFLCYFLQHVQIVNEATFADILFLVLLYHVKQVFTLHVALLAIIYRSFL